MKKTLNPIGIGVDAVGFFVAILGWTFIVWSPFILLYVLFYITTTERPVAVLICLFIEAIFLPLGFLLKWL
jgi:hypothetical protein